MTTNVRIAMPHGSAEKAVRVSTFATDGHGVVIPDREPLSVQIVTLEADSISLHLYPGVGVWIDEVTLPEPQG